MGKIIAEVEDIKREEGYLYYVTFKNKGYLQVGKAKMMRGARGKKKKAK